jgi:hypothetical protein
MNVVPDPEFFRPDPAELASGKPTAKSKKSWTLKPLRDAWANLVSRKVKSRPSDAVAEFLRDTKRVAEQFFPEWEQALKSHIDGTDLEFLAKRRLFEEHELFLYFYCGVVAIEGIKVRSLFDYAMASELESEINEQIDGILNRHDRAASDLVFDMFRTVKRAEVEDLIKPHDQVMKWISRLLELDKIPETKDLLTDFMFCQETAAPFASIQRHWWLTYKDTYRLVMPKVEKAA